VLFVQVAGDVVARAHLAQGRGHHPAVLHDTGAVGVEVAAGWRCNRARHVALEHDAALALDGRIGEKLRPRRYAVARRGETRS